MKTTNSEELALLLAWSEAKFAGFSGLASAIASEYAKVRNKAIAA